jgi:ferrous iron transport protein A
MIIALTQLRSGQSAIVQGFSDDLSRHGCKLLKTLGIRRSTRITLVRRAPLGDPLELLVVGSHFSLRRMHARHIFVSEIA